MYSVFLHILTQIPSICKIKQKEIEERLPMRWALEADWKEFQGENENEALVLSSSLVISISLILHVLMDKINKCLLIVVNVLGDIIHARLAYLMMQNEAKIMFWGIFPRFTYIKYVNCAKKSIPKQIGNFGYRPFSWRLAIKFARYCRLWEQECFLGWSQF